MSALTIGIGAALASQLLNGGFEQKLESWDVWGGQYESSGCAQGKACVRIENKSPTWSGVDQKVVLPKEAVQVKVKGLMRSQGVVPGSQSWEKARIAVEFKDGTGELVGGYPPVVCEQMGTEPWTPCERTYIVPEGAELVVLQAALGNATGSVWVDGLELFITDKQGKSLSVGQRQGPVDYGSWYTLKAGTSGSHFVDWSGLLDAPAGKHGFLKIDGDAFVFTDGTPARFWGGNLSAEQVFVSHAAADSLALRLSRMGANLLRLHHMDAPWAKPNLFGAEGGSGIELDSASLDKLDYLVAALKKKGIYVFMDLLVHREFPAKSIPAPAPDLGAKQVGTFGREFIDLQKDYARRLLTHVNAYTKLAYKDEASIVGSEFINESTIFSTFGGNIVQGYWWARLDSLWQAQGGKPGQLSSFDMDWGGPRPKLKAGLQKGDEQASLRFMRAQEASYYKEMYQFLRGLGVKYPLTGSTLPLAILPYQANNAQHTDFIASNEYWDHPQVWKIGNDWDRILYAPFDNQSQLRVPSRNMVQAFARFPVLGKPYMVTEWNHNYPNEYVLEGAVLGAAYGSLQGFSGMLQFDFDHQVLGKDRIANFKIGTMPEHVAQWVVAAPLFLRGDIRKADGQVVEGVGENSLYSLPAYSDFLDKNWALPFITRVAKDFDGPSQGSPEGFLDRYHDAANRVLFSQTRELKLDYGLGRLSVNSPRTQGALGFWQGDTVDMPALRITGVKNPHASVMLVSADKSELSASGKLYLVVLGPARMQGQRYNGGRTQLSAIGQGAVEMQVVEGVAWLKGVDPKKGRAVLREANGEAGASVPLKPAKEGGSLIDLSLLRSPVVEISVTR